MSEERLESHVVVVGAGPAGTAAAYNLAKAGLEVVLLERGDYPGAKNVMGGVLYRQMMDDIIPEFWKEAPVERHIVEQRLWVMGKESVVTLGHKNQRFAAEPYNNFTVLRAKFDQWFAGKAEEAGVMLLTETVAEDLIMDGDKVIGVKTDRGDIFCNVVIIADGVNSLLAKKAGFHPELKPDQASLAVKEIIALPKEKIEDRFNLEPGQGATIELVGEISAGMIGLGFIYTNQDTLSVGLGILVSELQKNPAKPYELIEAMKNHPMVKPLLAGGETKEYMAHLIPEGGYKAVPKLYGNGWLIVGDAAQLVNFVHREGSNLAMTSGRLAAETVIEAREDYSAQSLARYDQKIRETFVMKDLKKYEKMPEFLHHHPELFQFYPQLANEAAYQMLLVDGVSKADKQKAIWGEVRKKSSTWGLLKLAYQGWRAINS